MNQWKGGGFEVLPDSQPTIERIIQPIENMNHMRHPPIENSSISSNNIPANIAPKQQQLQNSRSKLEIQQLIVKAILSRMSDIFKKLRKRSLQESFDSILEHSLISAEISNMNHCQTPTESKAIAALRLISLLEVKLSEIQAMPIRERMCDAIRRYLYNARERENRIYAAISKLIHVQHSRNVQVYFDRWRYHPNYGKIYRALSIFQTSCSENRSTRILVLFKLITKIKANFKVFAFEQIRTKATLSTVHSNTRVKAAQIIAIWTNQYKRQNLKSAFLRIVTFSHAQKYQQQQLLQSQQQQIQQMQTQALESNPLSMMAMTGLYQQQQSNQRSPFQFQIDRLIMKEQAIVGEELQRKLNRVSRQARKTEILSKYMNLIHENRTTAAIKYFRAWHSASVAPQGILRERIELKDLYDEMKAEVEKLEAQLAQESKSHAAAGPIHMSELIESQAGSKELQMVDLGESQQQLQSQQQSFAHRTHQQGQLQSRTAELPGVVGEGSQLQQSALSQSQSQLHLQQLQQEQELNQLISKEMTYEQLDEIENTNVALKNQLERAKLMREAIHLYTNFTPNLEEMIHDFYFKPPSMGGVGPNMATPEAFFESLKAKLEESIHDYQHAKQQQAMPFQFAGAMSQMQYIDDFQDAGEGGDDNIKANCSMLEMDDYRQWNLPPKQPQELSANFSEYMHSQISTIPQGSHLLDQ